MQGEYATNFCDKLDCFLIQRVCRESNPGRLDGNETGPVWRLAFLVEFVVRCHFWSSGPVFVERSGILPLDQKANFRILQKAPECS